MKPLFVSLALVLVAGCGPFGDSKADAGKEACELYQAEMKDSPEALVSIDVMPELKSRLSDMDDRTRRAFADLVTADDANIFDSGTDPLGIDKAAAKVRSVCLSEHSVEIPSY